MKLSRGPKNRFPWPLFLLALAFGLLCLCPRAGAAVLLSADPAGPNAGWQRVSAGQGRVEGMLPAPWQDNSAWGKAWVRYGPARHNGRGALGIRVSRLEGGRCQLAAYPLPAGDGPGFYTLRISLANPDALPLAVGLRQVGPPYQFLWLYQGRFAAHWQTYSFRFSAPAQAKPLGLWLYVKGKGRVYLGRLKLARFSRAELVSAEPAPQNLLANSRLPLGLAPGWNLDRGQQLEKGHTLAPDPSQIGPSGAPALRVEARRALAFYSGPAPNRFPLQPHNASLALKGDGTLRLAVVCEGKEISGADFQTRPGEGWQRLRLPFDPPFAAHACALALKAKGRVWLDDFAIWPLAGGRPPARCEVALKLAGPAPAASGVVFSDQTARLAWAVSGPPSCAALRLALADAYGGRRELPPIELGPAFPRRGELRLSFPEKRGLGPFRLEAVVQGAAGKAAGPAGELVFLRLERPGHWGREGKDSPFGVHSNPVGRHLDLAKALGAGWARLHDPGRDLLGWASLEPRPGQWRFHDQTLLRYGAHGLALLGQLGTTPAWASRLAAPHTPYYDAYAQPRNPQAFARYVAKVAKRYRGKVAAWEVWNEPWSPTYFAAGHHPARQADYGYLPGMDPLGRYLELSRLAYEKAKRADPAATVLGLNGSADQGDHRAMDWAKGFAARGGLAFADAVCFHQYEPRLAGFPGDPVQKGLDRFKAALAEAPPKTGRLALWMTEGSPFPAGFGAAGFYRRILPYPPADDVPGQADRLARYLLALLAAGAGKAFLYTMHNHHYLAAGPRNPWSVLVAGDGSPHPAGAAMSALARAVEGKAFTKTMELTQGLFAFIFRGKGQSLAVLSSRSQDAFYDLRLAAPLAARDLFGNPLANPARFEGRLVYLRAPVDAARLQELLRASRFSAAK